MMSQRWSSAWGLVVFMSGCTASPGELSPEYEPPAERRVGLARSLQIELPPTPGREALSPGPSLFVSPTEVALERVDGRLERAVVRGSDLEADADPLLRGLYDALEAERGAAGLNIFVDRRVPLPVVVSVLYTAARGEWQDLRLIAGTPASPGALKVEAQPMCALHPAIAPPFDRIRADVRLEWTANGVLATALPRPAERGPFAVSFEEPPPDDEDAPPRPRGPTFPERVALRVGAGAGPQDVLDVAAVQGLAATLCAFNDGPIGVVLAPLPTTAYPELLAVADAFAGTACRGPVQLAMQREPPTPAPAGVAVAQLRAHVLALAGAGP